MQFNVYNTGQLGELGMQPYSHEEHTVLSLQYYTQLPCSYRHYGINSMFQLNAHWSKQLPKIQDRLCFRGNSKLLIANMKLNIIQLLSTVLVVHCACR